jgi:hypothetical protein
MVGGRADREGRAMMCNVGGTDRTVRIIVGVALLLAIFAVHNPVAQVVMGAVALTALGTAFIGFCPLNRLVGINTCHRPEARR